eukprot:UN28284
MGLVESAQMAQDWYLHKEEMNLAKRSFALDRRSLNIDLVNTIREDLRDLCSQRYGRIDNLMVVNTLVLSFRLDFVVKVHFLTYNHTTMKRFICLFILYLWDLRWLHPFGVYGLRWNVKIV